MSYKPKIVLESKVEKPKEMNWERGWFFTLLEKSVWGGVREVVDNGEAHLNYFIIITCWQLFWFWFYQSTYWYGPRLFELYLHTLKKKSDSLKKI